VTRGTAKDTLIARYNDLGSVKKLFDKYGDKIAALIVEPVAGNMGVIVPDKGFLQGLRQITKKHKSLLIFDEVITGFRLAKGGAQEYYGIEPDLTTLGKIIGGGLPVGAYGGKKKIMESMAPAGKIYQAGTLSGNPLAVSAGIATLQLIKDDKDFYIKLEESAQTLAKSIEENSKDCGLPVQINRVGSMMTVFFSDGKPVRSYHEAMKCSTRVYAKYFHTSLKSGVYLAPSQFEALFVSAAHSENDLDFARSANLAALKACR
jgi:glutamate-1-semialdehyde 2,1-aminomutase